jgi:hypothetical protein
MCAFDGDAMKGSTFKRPTSIRGKNTIGGYGSRLALWSAANLAGMETGLLVIREPLFRRLLNRIGGKRRRRVLRVPRPLPQQYLPTLADAIVGSSKITIQSVFGPPRGAVVHRPTSAGRVTFWDSATWYYPLPRDGLIAMAISFRGDIARAVEFFETPAGEIANQSAA